MSDFVHSSFKIVWHIKDHKKEFQSLAIKLIVIKGFTLDQGHLVFFCMIGQDIQDDVKAVSYGV